MGIDFNKLRNSLQQDAVQIEKQGDGNSKSDFKLVYPYNLGEIKLRLIYNSKMGGMQKKITRHNAGKSKVACLQVFGEDCDVCKAIQEIQTIKGKDCGVFKKYGYTTRGICYAQVVGFSDGFFAGTDNPPKIGEIVLFMYPKSIYDQITNILIKSGEHLEELVSKNIGKPFVVTKSQPSTSTFPDFSVIISPWETDAVPVFKDTAEISGEDQFQNLMENLPDLGNNFVPKYPTDEIHTANKALAETVMQEYLKTSIMNPGDSATPTPTTSAQADGNPQVFSAESIVKGIKANIDIIVDEDDTVPVQPQSQLVEPTSAPAPVQASVGTDSHPECFGNHETGALKCGICLSEPACFSCKK